jgi:hypothetical protein
VAAALSLVLVAATLLARQAGAPLRAAGSGSPTAGSDGMRRFYLTADPVPDATHALTACAPGYHMASLWEILDPSHLKYDTALGAVAADSGQGPPVWVGTDYRGWVRTGHIASTLDITGLANCEVWTSNGTDHRGTTAALPLYWGAGVENLHVWDTTLWSCAGSQRVWCVEDAVHTVYLPQAHKVFQARR